MTRLVIFDLDGTLLNTLDDLAAAANFALERHGLPGHPTEAYKQFVGNGVFKLVERMTPESRRTDKALLASIKADFDAYYAEHNEDCTKPYDGVLELLDTLRTRGIACTVLSNKPHEFTKVLCSQYFGKRIPLAFGHRQGYPHKPEKALVEEILKLTGIPAEQTVYVGDSGVDMQTAKNAGVYAAGVLWGFRGREELKKYGADALISSPQEQTKIIDARP